MGRPSASGRGRGGVTGGGRSLGRVRAAAVVGLVLSFSLLGGCFASKETRQGADRLAQALGTPTWASAIDVDTGRDGIRFKDFVRTVVTLRAEATVDDVAGFVRDLPARVEEAGLSDSFANRQLRFVGAGGGTLDLDWRVEPDPELVTSAVAGWLAVSAAYPSVEAMLRTDVGDQFRIDLGAGGTDAVASAYDALAGAGPAAGVLRRARADRARGGAGTRTGRRAPHPVRGRRPAEGRSGRQLARPGCRGRAAARLASPRRW